MAPPSVLIGDSRRLSRFDARSMAAEPTGTKWQIAHRARAEHPMTNGARAVVGRGPARFALTISTTLSGQAGGVHGDESRRFPAFGVVARAAYGGCARSDVLGTLRDDRMGW